MYGKAGRGSSLEIGSHLREQSGGLVRNPTDEKAQPTVDDVSCLRKGKILFIAVLFQ